MTVIRQRLIAVKDRFLRVKAGRQGSLTPQTGSM